MEECLVYTEKAVGSNPSVPTLPISGKEIEQVSDANEARAEIDAAIASLEDIHALLNFVDEKFDGVKTTVTLLGIESASQTTKATLLIPVITRTLLELATLKQRTLNIKESLLEWRTSF